MYSCLVCGGGVVDTVIINDITVLIFFPKLIRNHFAFIVADDIIQIFAEIRVVVFMLKSVFDLII